MNIPKVKLEDYLMDNFKDDCKKAEKLPKKFINFDKVRKDTYPQLSSVDFIDINYENRIYLYEITTFKEQIKKLKEEKNLSYKNCIEEELKREYRAKLFESLLLLSVMGLVINKKQIIFKILYCDDEKNIQKDVYGVIGFLKKSLKGIKQKEDKFKILPIEKFIEHIKTSK